MQIANGQYVQSQIGYQFKNRGLLVQAFTRKSYTEENPHAQNNEVLEFYGDKALDFIVMKKLSEYYGGIGDGGLYDSRQSEADLSKIKANLVCKEMLAKKIRVLCFHKLLIMGKGDIAQKAEEEESVQEDLFEAIIGAVALDSNWDVNALTQVVDLMLEPEQYFQNGFENNIDYVELLQQWYQKKYGCLPIYSFWKGIYNNELIVEAKSGDKYQCTLAIPPLDYFYALGTSKSDARRKVAKKAYQYIESKGLLYSLIDEIGKPEEERAVNQLQELYQKGYIKEPYYNYAETHDANGNPVWRCDCHIKELDLYFSVSDASKKQAKKKAAYQMITLFLSWREKK